MATNTEHKRLTCFLYTLMRDELPTGVVRQHVAAAVVNGDFSAPELELLARRYAQSVLTGSDAEE